LGVLLGQFLAQLGQLFATVDFAPATVQ
jgi:hypothetical protein